MTIAEANELADVLNRVRAWPSTLRITLTRRILETLEQTAMSPESAIPKTRGVPAEEVIGMLKTGKPAPDDETVKQWIDEHHMEKYG